MRNTLTKLIIGIIILSLFTVFLPNKPIVASGNTLHVGSGETYSKIQDAIDAANESDTINVHSGTYTENLQIEKTLTIIGVDGRGSTTINGDDSYKHTINVNAENVEISGFTVQNNIGKTNEYACVYLKDSTNCRITDNIIKNGKNGIYLVGSSGNTVRDNTIKDNEANGISLSQSTGNKIHDNTIQDNVQDGVYLSLSSSSNEIYENNIKNNHRYGVYLISSSNNNEIYHNDFVDNSNSNARDPCSNTWDDGSEGNLWDDYTGKDLDKDDIGDTQYDIPGGSNQDRYPLGYFVGDDPIAYIDSISPNPATQGKKVSFEGHGTDDGTILEWEWKSSKDDELSNSEDFSTSSLSVGTHTIRFRVKDDDEQWSDYATESLVIKSKSSSQDENEKPSATIATISPSTVTFGASVYFRGFGQDPDGVITEYSWRSSKDGAISNEEAFYKSDLSVGTHKIYFKVKDNDGTWSSEVSAKLVINPGSSPSNNPPTADSGGPYSGKVNASVSFDGSGSSDPDGDDIVSFSWDFGDEISGKGQTIEHTYNTTGNYTVKLTVTDSIGETHTSTTYVIVSKKQNSNHNGGGDNETPGFETIFFIIAITFLFYWKKRNIK